MIAKQFNKEIYELSSISKKTIEEHLKLYQGYINKFNEIEEKISQLSSEDFEKANQTYSNIRELKVEATFALSGIINHELYFENLTNHEVKPSKILETQIIKDYKSWDLFLTDLMSSGMSARGWVYLVWNKNTQKLQSFIGDSHNSYLVFNLIPLFALDVYEHAYFIDYGSNRKEYLSKIINNINWIRISEKFEKISK